MLAVELSREAAERFSTSFSGIGIAAVNAPNSTVLAGDPGAIAAAQSALEERGVACRMLPVNYAFHSAQMIPFAAELEKRLQAIQPSDTTITMISTVTGAPCAGRGLDASYWARNVRQPVLLAPAIRWLGEQGYRLFLEIGPHPVLTTAIARTIPAGEPRASVMYSLDRTRADRLNLLSALGGLYAAGYPVEWRRQYPSAGRTVKLPRYPWQRERFWLEGVSAGEPAVPPDATGIRGFAHEPSDDRSNARTRVAQKPAVRQGDPGDSTYAIDWIPAESSSTGASGGLWLILADDQGVAAHLEPLLTARGGSVVIAVPGERWREEGNRRYIDPACRAHFDQLCAELRSDGRPWSGIVHLWSLGSRRSPSPAGWSFNRYLQGCGGLLHLLQAISGWREGTPPRVTLVTRGAQAAAAAGESTDPDQAPLWGMARVLAVEHPEIEWRTVDLDSAAGAVDCARQLFQELGSDESIEDEVAFRGPVRLVPRLVPLEEPAHEERFEVRADATYLVTGGLGALGIEVAHWLVQRGARHLTLVGRRDPGPAAVDAIRAMESAGAAVRVAAVDVAEAWQVQALIQEIDQRDPSLRGVVHAAGVVDDGIAAQQHWNRFEAVMRPKIAGAWNLHQHTRHLPLDFFVMFSSAASLLGRASQISYAAANAYLDGLAHRRAAEKLPALSINWGAWGVGMTTVLSDPGKRRQTDMGLNTFDLNGGLRALERAITSSRAQVAALDMDWARYQAHRHGRAGSLASSLVQAASQPSERADVQEPTLLEELASTMPMKQRGVLSACVRRHVLGVLRLPASFSLDPHQGLHDVGFDSLMSLELRNGLQRDAGRSLPSTLAFDYPTMDAIVSYLAEVLDLRLEQSEKPVDQGLELQIGEDLASLSESEAEALLEAELASLRPALEGGV
jgi:acyl transferase domain-containing protein